MTATLLCGAGALLCWPGGSPVGRLRPSRPPWPARPWGRRLPELLALAVTFVAAALSTPLVAALAGGCALLAARALRSRQRSGRSAKELLALAEALGVLAAELSAGRELGAAARAAAAACPEAATGEALVAALRGDVGLPAGGTASTALRRISGAARLSTRTGCSLAAVATAVADDLRARDRAELELRSATAGPRASATVLAGLPLLGLAMGSGIGADPWQVLTGTGAGQVLLVGGVALEVVGVAWTGRLLRRAVAGTGSRGDGRAS